MKMNVFKETMRLMLPSVLICILLYIVLHEFGHAIVLWSVGAEITEFSILSAHVSYVGGSWTNFSDKWLHLNGALLPFVISVVYTMLYKKEYANRFYRVMSGIFVLMPISSLLAWVIVPVLYMFGQAPAGDDIYKFLCNFCFDYPAYVVSICAIVAICCSACLAVKKGVFGNFRIAMKELKDCQSE